MKYVNPFLKTKAQRDLEDSIKTFKIWFHMLDYGDPVDDGFESFNKLAKVVHHSISGPDKEVLAEAIRIFAEATQYNAWRKSYTKPINDAMDVVNRRFFRLPYQIKKKSIAVVLCDVLEAA